MLYAALLGLGMTTNEVLLNCVGHSSNAMHALAMLTILSRQSLSATTGLRCLHKMWSGLGVDADEHLAMASLNSCLEKGGHSILSHFGSSFRKAGLTG